MNANAPSTKNPEDVEISGFFNGGAYKARI